jgi:hypothetical protein
MHSVAADVDKSAQHGMEATITGLGNVFVEESGDCKKDDEDERNSYENPEPRARLTSREISVRHFVSSGENTGKSVHATQYLSST